MRGMTSHSAKNKPVHSLSVELRVILVVVSDDVTMSVMIALCHDHRSHTVGPNCPRSQHQ